VSVTTEPVIYPVLQKVSRRRRVTNQVLQYAAIPGLGRERGKKAFTILEKDLSYIESQSHY
jgi:hypothetical protein